MNQTTEKNNVLIAEFMGAQGHPKYNPTEWDIYITGCLDVDSDYENAQHFFAPDEMKYHISWDWLIPTIKKIYNDFSIDDEHILLIRDALAEADFDNAYKNVVNFINQTPLKN